MALRTGRNLCPNLQKPLLPSKLPVYLPGHHCYVTVTIFYNLLSDYQNIWYLTVVYLSTL